MNISKRIEKLKEQMANLKAQERELRTRQNTEKRKKENHLKYILAGAFWSDFVRTVGEDKLEDIKDDDFKIEVNKFVKSKKLSDDDKRKEDSETLERENSELTTKLNNANLTIATLQSTIETLEQEKTDLPNQIQISDTKSELSKDTEEIKAQRDEISRLSSIGWLVEESARRKIQDLNAFEEYIKTQSKWIKG